ncbi:MAG: glycosyltransferase [Candidatus Nanoarchaeia archaeon]
MDEKNNNSKLIKKKKFISVVIAALNEEKNIKNLTERLIKILENYNYEIIYSIAGKDKTLDELKGLKNKNIKIIYSESPEGLGIDFKKGFKNISEKADYVITMDADLNHQPEEIPSLLEKAEDYDIVIGSRWIKGGKVEFLPLWKRAISGLTNYVFYIITELNIKDKTSGFRIYKKEAIDRLYKEYKSKNFEFLVEMLLIAQKMKMGIIEVPITFKYRLHGKSKFRFRMSLGYLKLLINSILYKVDN